MDLLTLGRIVGGLVLLVAGGHVLVTSTSRLAGALGISPMVIGLTVVAFGTGAPELAVSLQSAGAGQTGLTVGNVVGSNIFNVLVVLGLSAAITPMVVHARFIRREVPLLILVTGAVWALAALDGLGRLAGACLLLGLVVQTILAVRAGRAEVRTVQAEFAEAVETRSRGWMVDTGLALAALAMLVVGSDWLVVGASDVARLLGVTELMIGLVIVAPGTSLPEVATSVIAALKGEREIAVGNVIGSNLFNLMGVLGLTALVQGHLAVPGPALAFDIPVCFAAALACLPIFLTGHRISRWEGAVLAAYYAAYLTWLILAATGHAAREAFGVAMLGFALPLTVLGIAASLVRARRGPRGS